MGSTWCARLGKIAGIRRGVNGTMTSWAKPRNSAIHRRAVERWTSSSMHSAVSFGEGIKKLYLTLAIEL